MAHRFTYFMVLICAILLSSCRSHQTSSSYDALTLYQLQQLSSFMVTDIIIDDTIKYLPHTCQDLSEDTTEVLAHFTKPVTRRRHIKATTQQNISAADTLISINVHNVEAKPPPTVSNTIISYTLQFLYIMLIVLVLVLTIRFFL